MISFGFAEPPTKEEKIKPPSIAVGEYIALIQNYEVGNLDRMDADLTAGTVEILPNGNLIYRHRSTTREPLKWNGEFWSLVFVDGKESVTVKIYPFIFHGVPMLDIQTINNNDKKEKLNSRGFLQRIDRKETKEDGKGTEQGNPDP